MTNRERIVNAAIGKKTDRMPVFLDMFLWRETMMRWLDEGLKNDKRWCEEFEFDPSKENDIVQIDRCRKTCWNKWFGLDAGFVTVDSRVKLGFNPAFTPEVIRETDNKIIMRDEYGIVLEKGKNFSAIPHFLSFPVETREDWEKLKEERLQINVESRMPEDWDAIAEDLNSREEAVRIGVYPYGLFGTLRDLMGVENFMCMFYEDPEMIKDMMSTLTDIWLAVYEKVAEKVKIHHVHMWEDMSGKNGSLISPAFVEEFMVPNYQRIANFCKEKEIEIFSVDTDGRVDDLIPLFLKSGMNMMLPFEVQAGCDIVKFGEQYPELCILGGIDKRAIGRGKDEIDKELKRIEPMFERGRFFPSLDHAVPPEISYNDAVYFYNSLMEMATKHGNA